MNLRASVLVLVVVTGVGRADRGKRHRGADPEQLVDINGDRVVNGCGPASTEVVDTWRLMDNHTYRYGGYGRCAALPDSDPSACRSWDVSFRDACNLHDAGYAGLLHDLLITLGRHVVEKAPIDVLARHGRVVHVLIANLVVDERLRNEATVDDDEELPGQEPYVTRHWQAAINMCKVSEAPSIGGIWGARTMWTMVRVLGDTHFNSLGGTRVNDIVASDGDR